MGLICFFLPAAADDLRDRVFADFPLTILTSKTFRGHNAAGMM
jgi:hypothetical protein